MAKPLYEIKVESNFDFSRLITHFDDIFGKHQAFIKDRLAQATKRNIADGNLRGLSNDTIELRKRGLSTFKSYDRPQPGMNKLSPTNRVTPLHYTGNLLNSIKPNDEGIEMLEYGLHHHRGFKTREGRTVFSRKFIVGTDNLKTDKGEIEEIQSDLVDRIKRMLIK